METVVLHPPPGDARRPTALPGRGTWQRRFAGTGVKLIETNSGASCPTGLDPDPDPTEESGKYSCGRRESARGAAGGSGS